MDRAQERVIRCAACLPADVQAVFAAVALGKVQIGGDDFEAIMQRGQCYRVTDQTGADLGAYVLKPMGAELWISAAAGRADVDLTAVMFALIEGQAREFDSVAFQTKRRGLKYKAMRHGYGVAQVKPDGSYIMRKAMK